MAGELHEISRLFGQLESKLETVIDNQKTSHIRLSAIEAKFTPLDQIATEHVRMKEVQDRHEKLVNQGMGYIAALSTAAGALGFAIQQLISYLFKKFGT